MSSIEFKGGGEKKNHETLKIQYKAPGKNIDIRRMIHTKKIKNTKRK